jgi:DNA invertase Pin-like site-specific DNA recombinase
MRLPLGSAPGHGDSEPLPLRHLARLAVVSVRPSTMPQVVDHHESTRLPDGLVQRAMAWGWSATRVLGMDEAVGQSGATAEGRHGFQRLVADVGLDPGGLVWGGAMARLARSSQDWPQRLETCALFGPVIAAVDGIDDPRPYHDRLVLGLKGTMREAARHLIQQRMEQGNRQTARRGARRCRLPIGSVREASGAMALDPDEPGHPGVRLLFCTFDALGTRHALGRSLAQQGSERGVHRREGPAKGTWAWRGPKRTTWHALLRHPISAGASAYGRRQVDGRRTQPGRPSRGRVDRTPHESHVVLKEAVPASLAWEQYEQNVAC